MDDRYKVSVFDVATGETYERDMTPEEIAALPEATNDTPEPQ
jgi:hypothetical protein